VRCKISFAIAFAQFARSPLEPVVDLFRDLEEPVVAADDPPVRDQPEVVQTRHARTQQLRYAAALRRRIDVQHASTLKDPGMPHEIIEDCVGSHASIGAQRSRADVDEFEHSDPSFL
jgi:hypothetical protein